MKKYIGTLAILGMLGSLYGCDTALSGDGVVDVGLNSLTEIYYNIDFSNL